MVGKGDKGITKNFISNFQAKVTFGGGTAPFTPFNPPTVCKIECFNRGVGTGVFGKAICMGTTFVSGKPLNQK